MKLDVVIGNPPYNNDIYIPFVETGHNLASTCSVFITPAKWQAKGGKDNERFRQDIVPHMSKIVYYPDACELFAIRLSGGITYYICDKNEHNEKNIINICNKLNIFNNEDIRPIYKILNNYGYKFIKNKVFKPLFIADLPQQFRYRYIVSKIYSDGNLNKQNFVLNPANIEDSKDISILSNNYSIIYSSDNIDNVKSFVSYVNTKYVRFCILIGLCALYIVSNEAWRFVPDPGAFDHIFTDEELYKKYNLTPEEINIIESVIKERK
jgi:site-specific DNA-methyltransferase (adenine-specific)